MTRNHSVLNKIITRNCIVCNKEFQVLGKRWLFCECKDDKHKIAKRTRSNDMRNSRRKTKGLFPSDERQLKRQRNKTKRRQYWLNKYKCARGCDICKFSEHSIALHFDHITPDKKEFNISRAVKTLGTTKLKLIFDEIRKCRLLCANHHAIISFKEEHYKQKSKLERLLNQ